MGEGLMLGIDIGTTQCKAAAFTLEGTRVAYASIPTPIHREGPEAAWHDPEELWDAACRVTRQAVAEAILKGHGAWVAVGISSFGEAGVLVGPDGQARGTILAWFDGRTEATFQSWAPRLDLNHLRQRTGLAADPTYSLFKILWLKENRPHLLEPGTSWLPVADWIAYRLTGQRSVGLTQASRTLLLDLTSERWHDELREEVGLPQALLPELRPPGQIIGRITPDAAAATGLPQGLPVGEAGHDQAMAAAGVGAIQPGILLNSCGTAETLFAAVPREAVEAALASQKAVIGHHALPGLYYAMVTLRASGATLDWFLRATGLEMEPAMGEAAQARAAEEGLFFFPYLRNVSDDPTDPDLHGGLILGLRETHTRAHMTRAALEGLAFEARRLLERLRSAGAVPREGRLRIRAVGGPSQNRLWMQLKAAALGVTLEACAEPEAGARGAAWLAVRAAGAEPPALAEQAAATYQASPGEERVYQERYETYVRTLTALTRALERP